MKNIIKKEILNTLIFILIFFILYIYLSKVLENNEAAVRSGKFYADTTSTDVIILGTSHSLYGIDPEIMQNSGIRNVYNLSGYSQVLPTSYWVLVNALDYCSPSVVVVDIYSIQSDLKYSEGHLSFMHSSMDAMPLTLHKIQMINDLFVDQNTKIEFYANFYLYHNRWKEIKLKDFEVLRYYLPSYHGMENGCIRDSQVASSSTPYIIDDNDNTIVSSVSIDYLEKIYDLCKQKDIQLVLIQLPFNASEDQQKIGNGVNVWANQHDVPYYNMFYDDNLCIDYQNDYIESAGLHLNVYGAAKTSKALAHYLVSNNIMPK